MLTFSFQDKTISALGFGTMRFPLLPGTDTVDEATTAKMLDHAMAHGVNYYDTAWGYHGGESERIVGRLLSAYPRDSYFLASKFPGYDVANLERAAEIFEEQLKKCQTDHFDFYLFHNVCEANLEAYLDPRYGLMDYLLAQKQAGRIGHIGFSIHGDTPVLNRFLEAYGDHMEFCQIQLNYMDYEFQNAKEKLEILGKRGIPVWVMEPLRGGRLCRLTEEEQAALHAIRPDETPAAMAFRYLQGLPGLGVILSGMSSPEQVKQNIAVFETDAPMNGEEREGMQALAAAMLQKATLPCTTCRYCVEYCGQGLDIPGLIALHNEYAFAEGGYMAAQALHAMPKEKSPAACAACRRCEGVCPQKLPIADTMKKLQGWMG